MKKLTVAFVRSVIDQQFKEEISYSRMVELLNEEVNSKDWNPTRRMPDYDGDYLCHIVRKNECGTFSTYQRVINCAMNEWQLKDERERVTHWLHLPTPPDRTVVLL